ncbi:MAG: hypothetical protein ACXU8U_05630, partial [Asticcacaulis sp.]
GRRLERCIVELFRGFPTRKSTELVKAYELVTEFYAHPLVHALYSGNYIIPPKRTFSQRRLLPAHIPAEHFSVAVLDMAAGRGSVADLPKFHPDNLYSGAKQMEPTKIGKMVELAVYTSGGDIDKIRQSLEMWYESVLDRIVNWGKTETRTIVFWIGLIAATFFNVNSVLIANYLFRYQALKEVYVVEQEARRYSSDASNNRGYAFVMPLGWGMETQAAMNTYFPVLASDNSSAQAKISISNGYADLFKTLLKWLYTDDARTKLFLSVTGFATIIFGWIITAAATTLGAPIWLVLIERISNLRSVKAGRVQGMPSGSDFLKDLLSDTAQGNMHEKLRVAVYQPASIKPSAVEPPRNA